MLTTAAGVQAGSRLRTVLQHGTVESTVDRINADTPMTDEQMYDASPAAGDQ